MHLPEDTSIWFLLFINLITGILVLAMGYYMKAKPPKEINSLYGYRTGRSMKNQDVWNYSQIIGAQMLLYWGWGMIIAGLTTSMLFPDYSMYSLFGTTVIGCFVGLFWSEKKISERFDKDGNPKS